jgi:hypothetical protein
VHTVKNVVAAILFRDKNNDKGTGLLTTFLIRGNLNLMWIYMARHVRKKGASGIYNMMMRNN